MASDIKVMLVTLNGLPSLPPFHVLDQLAQPSFDFALSLGCFVNGPNCGCHVPVAALMNIHVNLRHLACRIPEVLSKCLGRERCPAYTEKQRHGIHIHL